MGFSKISAKVPKVYIWGFVLLLSAIISLQNYYLGPKVYGEGAVYTYYNNYKIFVNSFFHLVHNQDLYILWPQEQWDLYKYSPTFAMFMAPFAAVPDLVGLLLWNILNIGVFAFVVKKFSDRTARNYLLFALIVVVELVTCMQNAQVNALIAGMILLAFLAMEKNRIGLAALLIVGSAFIKIFGIIALLLFLFYPQKWKAAIYTFLWTAVLFFLPLLMVSWDQLLFLYKSWGKMLAEDHSASQGISVSGFLQAVSGKEISKNLILLGGMFLLLLPLVRWRSYKNVNYRMLFLASILIWMVIFNHKAESPTFIIAMTGIAVWALPIRKNALDLSLLIFAFILTGFSASDLFPKSIRDSYIVPYSLKALPCLLVWLKITVELLLVKTTSEKVI